MKDLENWLSEQLDQNKVEPNSGLGQAISYMLKHWKPLTAYLRIRNVPLDNNVATIPLFAGYHSLEYATYTIL